MMQKADSVRLAWLAGLIDGEGCLNFSIVERNHHGHYLQFGARVVLSMKTGTWVNSVASVLEASGIIHCISQRKG